MYWLFKIRFGFGLFVHPFSHACNIVHISCGLQFKYYNTTYNIWTSTQYNIINNNTKFVDHLEVEFITISRYMCIYINAWPVQKVSAHFEYLENCTRGLDETWQPVRGDLTVYP